MWTPGPWRAFTDHPEITAVSRRGEYGVVATVGRDFWADRDANARLIAEAPAMLALLRRIDQAEDCLEGAALTDEVVSIAKDARALLARVERKGAP